MAERSDAVIVLATLNARYLHASLGLRYLFANLGELQPYARLLEFIVGERPEVIVEALLAARPRIIGFGVYIWNVEETTRAVALLKQARPDIRIVLGGPEVSHEYERQPIVRLADYLITGPADLAFAALCRRLLAGAPSPKVIHAEPPPLAELVFPYRWYTDEDIAHRLIYVEASRGCPFKCAFCLSALDKTAWPFDLTRLLAELERLHRRGARHFKFVDRTFNLNIAHSLRILEFFLERLDDRLFLHFELVPDRLPERLKAALAQFPPGSLQLEIGVQSFNPGVQAAIDRVQDNCRTEENLAWLRRATHAHLHTDLIVGLPGENLASFAQGFNRLVALEPQEIQVGVLKRLRGAPLSRRADGGVKYNPYPPYNIICSDLLDFSMLQRLGRFARYWDMIGNSGRFRQCKPLLLGDDPFARFLRFSDWLYEQTRQTHRIALERLFERVFEGMTAALGVDETAARAALEQDYRASGLKSGLACLARTAGGARPAPARGRLNAATTPVRQARHNR